jgi:hypothetical protein
MLFIPLSRELRMSTYSTTQCFYNKQILLFLLLVFCTILPVAAQNDTTGSGTNVPVQPPSVVTEPAIVPLKIQSVLTQDASIGEELRIQLDSASAHAIRHNLINYRSLELFLDGMRFHSLHPDFISPNILSFSLIYDDSSRQEWRNLLGSLESSSHVTRIGMGFENDQEIVRIAATPGYIPQFTFIIYRKGWFVFAILAALAALALFWFLAVKSDIIRDSAPPEPSNGGRRPYSLARFQMAIWFFVILIGYLFIFLLTGQFNNVLNDQSLILMGIGAGTALGAAMIDSTKSGTARSQLTTLIPQKTRAEAELQDLQAQLKDVETQLAALKAPPAEGQPAPAPDAEELQTLNQNRQSLKGQIAEKKSQIAALKDQIDGVYHTLQNPVSEGFLRDILTDSNGISFHRFQILVWTLVLVAIFCTEVYNDLLMPEFSTSMLALMGISSGTYLGFKIPEQYTNPTPPGSGS